MNNRKKFIITLFIAVIIIISVPVFAANNVKNTSNTTKTSNTINKANLELENIQIEGKNIEPTFNKDIHQYKVAFEGEETTLNITAKPVQTGTNVTIVGNENLVDGQNIITIIVTDEKETNANIYQIYVEKNIVVEQGLENLFDITGIKNIIKIGLIAVIAIIALIIIIVFIKIVRKKAKKKNKEIENTVINEDLERKRRIQAINERISKQYEKEEKRNKKNGRHSK